MKLAVMAVAIGISLAGPAQAQVGKPQAQTLADLIAQNGGAVEKGGIDITPPTPTPTPPPGTTPPPRVTPPPTPGPRNCSGVFCPKDKPITVLIKPPTLEQIDDMDVINPGRPRDY